MSLKTISEEYRALNKKLHEDENFGVLMNADRSVAVIAEKARIFHCQTMIDYGCGRGYLKPILAQKLPTLRVLEYDPAVEGKEICPQNADLVFCGDVLEHIEPHLLNNVLAHIKATKLKVVIAWVDHMPAIKTLADGRNAHILQRPHHWWKKKLESVFSQVAVLSLALIDGDKNKIGKTLFMAR